MTLLNSYTDAAVSSAKEAALIGAGDVGACAVVSVVTGLIFVDILGLLLLLEGAGMMLVGGALGFAGQPGVRSFERILGTLRTKNKISLRESTPEGPEAVRLGDIRAAFYMMIGVIFFLTSFALTLAVR